MKPTDITKLCIAASTICAVLMAAIGSYIAVLINALGALINFGILLHLRREEAKQTKLQSFFDGYQSGHIDENGVHVDKKGDDNQ